MAMELLEDFGAGDLTAKQVVKYATGSVNDGSMCDDTAALAAFGTDGTKQERGIQRWVSRQPWRRLVPTLYSFACWKWRGPVKRLRKATHACLLPHEVTSTLAANQPLLHAVMGSQESWASYWEAEVGSAAVDPLAAERIPAAAVAGAGPGTAAVNPLERPPAAAVAGAGPTPAAAVASTSASTSAAVDAAAAAPAHFIPLGIHGDDAGVAAGEKVLIITWGSLTVPENPTLDTRIVFSMIKGSEGSLKRKATVQGEAYRVLTWSFRALAHGYYPTHDHAGVPFSTNHHPERFALAGKPLALLRGQPVGARWHELRGDWKFLREACHFTEHYNCKRRGMCHLCKAMFSPAHEDFFGDFSRAAPFRDLTTHGDFVETQRTRPKPPATPLLELPGFNFRRVFFDIMHTVDLGTLQLAIPSALHELVFDEGVFGQAGARGVSLEDRLLEAHAHYVTWCAANDQPPQARAFTEAWVKLPDPQIGQLQAKAAATRTMAYWMRDACAPLKGSSRHAKVRWGFFFWTCRADLLMRRAGRHLTVVERQKLARFTESALACYGWLHRSAKARRVELWKVIPKHHAWTHIAYDNMGTNPRSVHCYADEDMVGKAKRLYNKRHGRTAPARSMQRYSLRQALRWRRTLRESRPALRRQ